MTSYDMILIGVVVVIDLWALWMTVDALSDTNRTSELRTAIVAFTIIFMAITGSFYTAVSITQSSHKPELMKTTYRNGHTYRTPNRCKGKSFSKTCSKWPIRNKSKYRGME